MSLNFAARRSLLIISFCCLFAASAFPLLAADRQSAGKYEFTVTTDGKAHVSTYCVTPEDARAVNADEKTGRAMAEKAAKGTCSVTAYQIQGPTILSTLTCGEGGRASKVTYHGDTFEGETTYTFVAGGKHVTRVSQIKAKRLGVCQ